MLVLLLPDQVMHYWNLIKDGLVQTLPPYVTNSPHKIEEMMMGFILGKAQCWVYVSEGPKVKVIMVTRNIHDDFTDSDILEITSLVSEDKVTGEEWIDGFETLRKYAKGRKCDKIVFYTDNELILKITKKLGFNPTYIYSEYKLEN